MSQESKLLRLLEDYDEARGDRKYDALISLRKYLRGTELPQVEADLQTIKEKRHLRALIAAGPHGDLYKATMARLWAVESGAV